MSALPSRSVLDGSGTPTTSAMKVALGAVYDYLSGLLGAAGDAQTAKAALGASDILGIDITASVASNALTVGLNPTVIDFRNVTLTNGVTNTRNVAASISLIVPSGGSLGSISGQSSRLALLAIDNAGTVELAVVNMSGGNQLDETNLISTTAISSAATSASVIYSTTARSNVPYRIVGFVDITEATAGTWATAPTLVQGVGGQALAAMSSLGYGQTWQAVTRTSGTTYYNTTGKPIMLSLIQTIAGGSDYSLSVNGLVVSSGHSSVANVGFGIVIPIPPNSSYVLTSATISSNLELR